MTLRFLADADLKRAIVSGVKRREPGIDFRSAQAAGLEGIEDPEVLAIASREGRILVSHDYGTMPRHFRDFCVQTTQSWSFLDPAGLSRRCGRGDAGLNLGGV